MTKEEYINFANALKNNYTIDFDKLPEFCDMAISVLSETRGDFDGMTNGDVLNKVLRQAFPRTIFIRGINECNNTKLIVYSDKWENEPYEEERIE